MGVQWQNPHQDIQNTPKPKFLAILDLPDHPDGIFRSTPQIPGIPNRYHMWGYNEKIPIKTPKILQNPSIWTFLTFLIILIVFKNPGRSS